MTAGFSTQETCPTLNLGCNSLLQEANLVQKHAGENIGKAGDFEPYNAESHSGRIGPATIQFWIVDVN